MFDIICLIVVLQEELILLPLSSSAYVTDRLLAFLT
jgi:hypothetical protein